MFLVQIIRRAERDKKLTGIVIFSTIGHADQATMGEAETRVKLVFEGFTVYWLATHARAGRVAAYEAGLGNLSREFLLEIKTRTEDYYTINNCCLYVLFENYFNKAWIVSKVKQVPTLY